MELTKYNLGPDLHGCNQAGRISILRIPQAAIKIGNPCSELATRRSYRKVVFMKNRRLPCANKIYETLRCSRFRPSTRTSLLTYCSPHCPVNVPRLVRATFTPPSIPWKFLLGNVGYRDIIISIPKVVFLRRAPSKTSSSPTEILALERESCILYLVYFFFIAHSNPKFEGQ